MNKIGSTAKRETNPAQAPGDGGHSRDQTIYEKGLGSRSSPSYLNELDDRFRAIANGTALSVIIHAEGRSFRRCRYHEHLIFFEETLDAIEIVRVLHPRRNIAAQLRDE